VCVTAYIYIYIYIYIYFKTFFRIAHLITFINSLKKSFKVKGYKEFQGSSFFVVKFLLTLIRAAEEQRLR